MSDFMLVTAADTACRGARLGVLLRAYGRASRLCALPEAVPRLAPRWLCRSGQRMRQTTHISDSCTRKCTRVPTLVSCCSAAPYHPYTPLPPPPPPRSAPDDCAVAYAACVKKIQNQDSSFDPPRTPLSYTPLSFAAGGRGGGQISNAMCVKTTHPAIKPFGRRSEGVQGKVVVLVRTPFAPGRSLLCTRTCMGVRACSVQTKQRVFVSSHMRHHHLLCTLHMHARCRAQ